MRRCSGELTKSRPPNDQRLLRLLIEQDHAPSRIRQLGRRDQAGKARANHDCIRPILTHAHPSQGENGLPCVTRIGRSYSLRRSL